MGICPFLKGNECLREGCQLFIAHRENSRCALWWMGMEAMADVEEERDEGSDSRPEPVEKQPAPRKTKRPIRQWG